MDSTELVKVILQVVGPVLLGVGAGVLSSIFTTSRKLRQDLVTDVELLAKMPRSTARAELSRDIIRRTHALVAATRHRAVTPMVAYTAVTAVVLLAIAFWMLIRASMPFEEGEVPNRDVVAGAIVAPVLIAGVLLVMLDSRVFSTISRRTKHLRVHVNLEAAVAFRDAALVPLVLLKFSLGLAVVGLAGLGASFIEREWVAFGVFVVAFLFFVSLVTQWPAITRGQKEWKVEDAEIRSAHSTSPQQ